MFFFVHRYLSEKYIHLYLILIFTCKPSGAGQTLIFSITVIVYLYLHETIINELYICILSHFTQRPLQRDTVFGGDAIFDNQKMHPLNPPIVRGATYDASPKRSKGDAEFDGDAKYDVTPGPRSLATSLFILRKLILKSILKY